MSTPKIWSLLLVEVAKTEIQERETKDDKRNWKFYWSDKKRYFEWRKIENQHDDILVLKLILNLVFLFILWLFKFINF